MSGRDLPLLAALTFSFAFCVAGLVQLAGFGFVRRAYLRHDLPPKFHRIAGTLNLMAGLFLAVPETRIWGVVLAEMIAFVAVLFHLRDRQYIWSASAMLVMAALPPALLTVTV